MPAEEGLDRELMAEVARGDAAAFETIVARHRAAVFRYARSLARDDAAAEDALQETFLAAWRNAGAFRGEAPLRAWLFTVARNFVFRHARTRAGEPEETVPLDALGELAGWGSAGDPQEAMRRLEERERVENALEALSTADREILLLRELEGFTGEEAAKMLGLTLPAQKTRLHRARLRFAAELRRGMLDG